MDNPGVLKVQFYGKEDTKKFLYVYMNVVMKEKTEKEKEDKFVTYLIDE